MAKNIFTTLDRLPFDTFSLQDTFSPAWSDVFFSQGCKVDGIVNCTAACVDPRYAFMDLETVHNCALYVWVANISAARELSDDDARLVGNLDIVPGNFASARSQAVAATLANCSALYTVGITNDTIASWSMTTDGRSVLGGDLIDQADGTGALDFTSQSVDLQCLNNVPRSILNMDIGGIGVSDIQRLLVRIYRD